LRAFHVRPDLYSRKEEIERWKKRDPIPALIERLRTDGRLSDDDIQQLEQRVANELDDPIGFAEGGTVEPVEDLERYVYWESAHHERGAARHKQIGTGPSSA